MTLDKITFRLTDELKEKLLTVNSQGFLNTSALIREAVKKFLDNSENYTPTEKGFHHEI